MPSARRKSVRGTSRKRSRSSRAGQGAGQATGQRKKLKSKAAAAEEELFKVSKIVGSKIGKNGVELYKTRWEGYSPSDDTWEPLEHVAGTGFVDRYKRSQRERALSTYTPGVAVIEYDDGERQTIDLRREKFRQWMDVSDDDRDDDSVNGDDDVNNFGLIQNGAMIELLWPYAQIYFSCKVISWTPLPEGNGKKSSKKRLRANENVNSDGEDEQDSSSHSVDEISSSFEADENSVDGEGRVLDGESASETAQVNEKNIPSDEAIVTEGQSYDGKHDKSSDSDEGESAAEGNKIHAPEKRALAKKNNESRAEDKSNDEQTNTIAAAKEKDIDNSLKEKESVKKRAAEDSSTDEPAEKKTKEIAECSLEKGVKQINTVGSRSKMSTTDEINVTAEQKQSSSQLISKSSSSEREGQKQSGTQVLPKNTSSEERSAESTESVGVLQKKESVSYVEENDKPKDQGDMTPIAVKVPTFAKKSGALDNQNYERGVSDKSHSKMPASYPEQQRKDGLIDVSDDDSKDVLSQLLCKRNVSEGSQDMTSFLGRTKKQTTASRYVPPGRSLPHELDIDALATAVATKQAHPLQKSAARESVAKANDDYNLQHDAESQFSNNNDFEPECASKSEDNSKKKVGRGVPLYSDDESFDNEWRGEGSTVPKKLSFEELWKMKLERTQSMMNMNRT